ELVSAIGTFGDKDSIVEVFCSFAVDGDDGESAEVAAAVDFNFIEEGDGPRLGEHLTRKYARKLMFENHHLDIYTEVVRIAEHFVDAPEGGLGGRGPACDFNVDVDAIEIVVMHG